VHCYPEGEGVWGSGKKRRGVRGEKERERGREGRRGREGERGRERIKTSNLWCKSWKKWRGNG